MTIVRIGAARIADHTGTHAAYDDVDYPSAELVALAEAGTVDPNTGEPYCRVVAPGTPPDVLPEPPKEPEPEPDASQEPN